MSENTDHPKRLWLVEEDARLYTHFFVREVDVEPVQRHHPPRRWSRYHICGQPAWDTVELDREAYRTKAEALAAAVNNCDDVLYEWEQRKRALEKQLAAAEDEAAQEEDERRG